MRRTSRRRSGWAVLLLLTSGASVCARPAGAKRVPTSPQPAQQPTQRLPRQAPARTVVLLGVIADPSGRGAAGAVVELRNMTTGESHRAVSNAEGVFRLFDLPPGKFELRITGDGLQPYTQGPIVLKAGDLVALEITIEPAAIASVPRSRLPRVAELGPALAAREEVAILASYRELPRRPDASGLDKVYDYETLPAAETAFAEFPYRWDVTMPEWQRYGKKGEFPYVKGRWWDPFNRNRLKGDEPIWPSVLGQRTFFNFTGSSETLIDARRLPMPSGASAARPASEEFFGKGGQGLFVELLRLSFDLFHGDTAFRPIDWRVRVTPAVSLNYLRVRERGIVNIDVRRGTTRFDSHIGLQEAFVEVKLKDLSPNFDFISLRAGIQQFTSDFRGFVFVEEQPGLRFFGNFYSNRWEYNLAYFNFLEKDTNSALNTFKRRHQQVIVGNLYMQDFLVPGYTTQFSIHWNKDEPTFHFDENDFLVRPAPIGAVHSSGQLQPHRINVAYLGWTGNGHIGRLNISHAFYQALGRDSLNPLAGRRVTINAQMAALELSIDKDWARLAGSFFWSSGDENPRDDRARGFDSIVDVPVFAGGIFSLWNREGIRLTGSGVALTPPSSFLPSLRSSKEEGQANFVNPGIFIFNAGADIELAPKLRSILNVNFLRFQHTEPLELLLFQAPIRNTIGVDYGVGLQYRPPLTENIIVTGGASALTPGRGFTDIYTAKTLFSLFANVRFQF